MKPLPLLMLTFLSPPLFAPSAPAMVQQVYYLPDDADRYQVHPKYREIIMEEAAAAGIPFDVATGLMWSESERAGADCVGRSGDEGLFQLNPRYHEWHVKAFNNGQEFDPFDPRANTRVAMRLFVWLWHQTGTLRGAVEAYKAGLGGWSRGVSASTRRSALGVLDVWRVHDGTAHDETGL